MDINMTQEASAHSAVSLRVAARLTQTFNITPERTPSHGALEIMGYVASSTRLSPSEKSSILRIAAFIDEHAGGNEKLLKKLGAVVQLMEMLHEQGEYPRHAISKMAQWYDEWRDRWAGEADEAVTFSIELSVELELETLYESAHKVGVTDESTAEASLPLPEQGILA